MLTQETLEKYKKKAGIAITGDVITIQNAALEAPKAVVFLADLPEDDLPRALEELLEYGAATAATMRASASIQLLEAKVAELSANLDREVGEKLGSRLQKDRDEAKEALNKHVRDVTALMAKYTDPASKDGLPAKTAESLNEVARAAVRQVDALLQGGEEGVLAKLGDRVVARIKELEDNLINQTT